MRKFIVCVVLLSWRLLPAQQKVFNVEPWQHPGAPPGFVGEKHPSIPRLSPFVTPIRTNGTSYSTTFYTFNDIAVFSYIDSTSVTITTSAADTILNKTLRADSFDTLSPGNGIYMVTANEPFSLLTGDAITSFASGYFAVDANGSGVSTKLNTWMMKNSSDIEAHFILFSYDGITQFTIRDLGAGNLIYRGFIDTSGYFDFPNVSLLEGKAIQVSSDKPVSALSYNDQGYYIPSANGTFAGNLFYGFSGHPSGLENSITLTSYSDSNSIVITDLSNGDTILVDTLNHQQVRTLGVSGDIFWKVASSGTLTAANIPFEESWERITPYYYQLTEVADSTGKNIGTSFVVPTTETYLSIFSYTDNNQVRITLLGDISHPYQSQELIKDTILQNGGVLVISTELGDNVYQVQSGSGVSVVESFGGGGGAFVPIRNPAVSLADLAIAQSDIVPDTTNYQAGQDVTFNLTIHNYGSIAASNVAVVAYDGNPDLGVAPVLLRQTVPVITAGDSARLSFSMVIPPGWQYHSIYVKVDPNNSINELNKSNNEAFRYLLPGKYLQSPYAVYFSSPGALKSQGDTLSPNPFTVTADIFNTGTTDVSDLNIDVSASGMTILSGATSSTINDFSAGGHLNFTWSLRAYKDSTGFDSLTVNLFQPFIDTTVMSAGILVPDTVAPPVPQGLNAEIDSSGPGRVKLKWTADSIRDLAGYKIYYSTDSTNLLAGTAAAQGSSPIYTSNIDSFVISQLVSEANYWFALSAYDFSANESSRSQSVKVFTITSVHQNLLPRTFAISQNYPNPFNPTTIINYQLPSISHVLLKVYDVLGREVATLVDEVKAPGKYEVGFNGSRLASGVYFYRIVAGNYISTKKMLIVK
ncbi:MAG TPA: CARDB domain-containing protein [Candidatus Acidoferrales bacterium]|nr:CARDB domain-containing protein [Candidatus Acidoferrales bacterium]